MLSLEVNQREEVTMEPTVEVPLAAMLHRKGNVLSLPSANAGKERL